MCLNRIVSGVLILIVLILTWGCAGSRAPRGWLSVPSKAQTEAYGGWITIYSSSEKNKIIADGELIAVEAESLFVLQGAELVALARWDISKAKLTAYDSKKGGLALWTFVGSLSTASHGWGAILSFPLWIIGGTAATVAQSHAPNYTYSQRPWHAPNYTYYTYPQGSWNDLAIFSRFPQGLPDEIDRSKLFPKFFPGP